MRRATSILISLLLALCASAAFAQDAEKGDKAGMPPPPAAKASEGEPGKAAPAPMPPPAMKAPTPAPVPEAPPPGASPAASTTAEPGAVATASAAAPASGKWFSIGLHLGMGFPQPFSELRNFGVYELEFGFILPAWGRRLQIGGLFGYSEPGSGNGRPDPRLGVAGADYRWDLSNQELVFELNFLVRVFELGKFINPYFRTGFRVYLLNTEIDGTANGGTFGVYNEKFTEPGFVLGGGLEIKLGPGALNFELRIDYSNMNRRVSGDSNTGMLTIAAGYRFFL